MKSGEQKQNLAPTIVEEMRNYKKTNNVSKLKETT
jgi:hypothetical protein